MSDGEQLSKAEQAYTSGDFRGVRALTASLAGSSDADTARRAHALRSRVEVDRGSAVVLALCLLAFAGIVVAYAR